MGDNRTSTEQRRVEDRLGEMGTARERLAELWAKTGSGPDGESYHPLICHMSDSAAVSLLMWDRVGSKYSTGL